MTFQWILDCLRGKPKTEEAMLAEQERLAQEERECFEFLTGGLHPDDDSADLAAPTDAHPIPAPAPAPADLAHQSDAEPNTYNHVRSMDLGG